MKKYTKSLLAFVLGLSVLSGCSQNEPTVQVPTIEADETKTADVIVVGAGGAGLSAAIAAVDAGAESVIIVEKTGQTGGSLNFTGGTMSGAETIIQEIDGIEDTKESYVQDILKNGDHKGNEALIRAFVDEDVDAIQWLWDNGLSDNQFSVDRQTGTMSVFAPEHALYSQKRSYKPSPDNKEEYKSAVHEILDTVLKTYDEITVDYMSEATQLVPNEKGQVLTVVAENSETDQTVRYDATHGIIMATGGYSGNSKMLGSFTKYGDSYLAGGSSASDGYGIYMMQEMGAMVDKEAMGYVPTFPMGLSIGEGIPGQIAPTYLWKTGGICVNQEGKRFVDETSASVELREVALEEQTNAIQYDIFTDNIIQSAEELNASVFWTYFYAPGMKYNQYVIEADSIEDLAEKLGMPAENLKETIEAYNANVESQTTDEFGRQYTQDSLNTYNMAINKVEGEKYYAVALKALCVMTLGGVSINENTQVLDTQGNVIPGLYAAGEVTGGIWGRFVSGGTGVMGPVAFGRIAGRNVMGLALNDEPYTLQESMNTIDPAVFEKEEKEETAPRFDMNTPLKDGEYQAEVDGQEGKMIVKTTITDGKIAQVEVVEQHETESVAKNALEKIPASIVENNSCDVDVSSGATLTSNRIMDAVAACLEQAK